MATRYEEAKRLDNEHPSLADEFFTPTQASLGISDSEDKVVYFCGNSLGLMPKGCRQAVIDELDAWATLGVRGHFKRPNDKHGWVDNDEPVIPLLADLVGAKPDEVALTASTTLNLNSMLQTFYKPTSSRYKIFFEENSFPSDIYSFQNLAAMHNLNSEDTLLVARPREGEKMVHTEDILEILKKHGHEIAIMVFSGVNYFTGQFFDIETITKAAHDQGCVVGWDLAHAAGNVELHLHDWQVDFAVWCSYKYLNAGAGNIAGLFVHEAHHDDRPRPSGWFGVSKETRFLMEYDFCPIKGARGWCQSNNCFVGGPCLLESLKLFERAGGMKKLGAMSNSLTGFLDRLLKESKHFGKHFTIITPDNENERGNQLSLDFSVDVSKVMAGLLAAGIVADERKPSVMRLAASPLYNTHKEVLYVAETLEKVLDDIVKS